jgi:predicted dinucleotide-binding enzyme
MRKVFQASEPKLGDAASPHKEQAVMSHAIIGTGHIGGALASHFGRKGIEVRLANRSGGAALADLARKLGPSVKPVSVKEALSADIVVLGVPFTSVADAVRDAAAWNGRIVVDATNAVGVPPSALAGRLSTQIVAEAVPGARVVKAFNTLFAAVLAQDPVENGGHRVVFMSGDDDGANKEVARLVEQLGFAPVVLGPIAEGGRLQQFGAPLAGLNLLQHPNPGR